MLHVWYSLYTHTQCSMSGTAYTPTMLHVWYSLYTHTQCSMSGTATAYTPTLNAPCLVQPIHPHSMLHVWYSLYTHNAPCLVQPIHPHSMLHVWYSLYTHTQCSMSGTAYTPTFTAPCLVQLTHPHSLLHAHTHTCIAIPLKDRIPHSTWKTWIRSGVQLTHFHTSCSTNT